jgi:hypothetical protein
MRRFQSAILIFSLLAIPLALPARTGPCAESQCSRLCALIMHSAHAEQDKHRHCTCGMTTGSQQCAGHSGQQTPDFGLNAPMPPTMPSARTVVITPDSGRRALVCDSDFACPGFRFELLQPPRA